MLDQVRIILVNTSHTGNIGSAARAMKTMGLSRLYLVDPESEPDGKSVAMAAGASDILNGAIIVDSLDKAIADCPLVIGASARPRSLSWPMLSPRETGAKIVSEGAVHPVALVFGRERTGLTNDELQLCHYHVNIPANPEYSSLNLAMAVQTLCYEVRTHYLEAEQAGHSNNAEALDYPRAEELNYFYQHLEQTLLQTEFILPQHPGQVMNKLKCLFSRARPDKQEINMLRGILSSVQKSASTKPDNN